MKRKGLLSKKRLLGEEEHVSHGPAMFFRTIWLLFVAHMRSSFRSIVFVIVGLVQPICYLLLFAPLLENLTKVPGFPTGNIYNVFTPGLLIMITILSTGLAGFYVIFRLQNGVMERWLVTPMSRFALLLSMVLRDVVVLLIQSILLCGSAILMGFHPDWWGLLLLVPLLMLVCIVMATCSYGLALLVRDIRALASVVNFFAIPLVLLSGITLPLSLGPETIQAIGKANPFAYAVDAARLLVSGTLGEPKSCGRSSSSVSLPFSLSCGSHTPSKGRACSKRGRQLASKHVH